MTVPRKVLEAEVRALTRRFGDEGLARRNRAFDRAFLEGERRAARRVALGVAAFVIVVVALRLVVAS